MMTCAIHNLRDKSRRLLRRFTAGAVVLLYHRVADLDHDPQLLAVSSRRFDEHMRLLARHFEPVSLSQLVSRLHGGGISKRTVVVTFDDGYEDNLQIAKPILQKHGIPATVFVTSGAVDSDREFYWDKLDDILLSDRSVPETLNLQIGDQDLRWRFSPDEASGDRRSWNVLASGEPTSRQAAYMALCDLLRPLPYTEQRHLVQQLSDWAGIDLTARATHRAMTTHQLQQLTKDDSVEVGAHTIDHPVLATLSPEQQQHQIVESKSKLESILGQAVQSFSYPYGTRHTYSPQTIEAVANAGFVSACSNFSGLARRGTDPYQLPRVLVRNWEAAKLLQTLEGVSA